MVRPSLLFTNSLAAASLCPLATSACTRVVTGETMVAPAGAVSLPVKGRLVAISVPPVTVAAPHAAPLGAVKLPFASVVVAAQTLLLAKVTVAPFR